jgi:hypothetical protein
MQAKQLNDKNNTLDKPLKRRTSRPFREYLDSQLAGFPSRFHPLFVIVSMMLISVNDFVEVCVTPQLFFGNIEALISKF